MALGRARLRVMSLGPTAGYRVLPEFWRSNPFRLRGRWAEGIAKMNDGRRVSENNVNDIEANFLPRDFGMVGILAGGAQQAELLLFPNRPVRCAVLVCL